MGKSWRVSTHTAGVSDTSRLTDQELMVRVQADDTGAFATLYDRLAGPAYGIARRVCLDPSLAADAVQEAFISMWRARALYTPARGDVPAWAYGIVRNRAIDALRRAARHSRHDGTVDARYVADTTDVCASVIAGDDASRLRTRIALLPAPQQQVLVMTYYGELSHTQIAEVLDVPLGTVKGRARLGLAKLRADPVS